MSVRMVINMNISVRGAHQLLCGNKDTNLSSVTSYTMADVRMSVFFSPEHGNNFYQKRIVAAKHRLLFSVQLNMFC